MKSKEQSRERSKPVLQDLEDKDLKTIKAGLAREACACACLASAECAC
ncbi:MAG: hypothetical protein JF614_11675 [Acidobacteria bacterium]|nr:hypothetical protein [Acidobacteriota bacterium]